MCHMSNKSYTAPNMRIHLWAVGAMANYWMSAVMFSFVSLVFITSYEMNPAWVATAMMLPRLVDLVVDPMIGRLSDNTHTRWGRRRPFIFVSTLLGAMLVVGIWWMPLDWVHTWKGFAYLLAFSISLYANIGVFDMSHSALGYELSDDYNQRSKVQATRALYFSLGSMGGGFTYWIAQRPTFGAGHAGEINGFRCLSLAMAAIILLAGMVSVFASRERFQNINRKQVSLLPAIKATLKNRAFVVILVMRFVNVLGGTLFGSLLAYIGIYSVCQGDKELYNKVISRLERGLWLYSGIRHGAAGRPDYPLAGKTAGDHHRLWRDVHTSHAASVCVATRACLPVVRVWAALCARAHGDWQPDGLGHAGHLRFG